MTERSIHCPDAAEFASYMMGMLSDEARERIDRHIAQCARCREHLAAVVRLKSDSSAVPVSAAFPRAWARVEELLAAWSPPPAPSAEKVVTSADVITLFPRPRPQPAFTVDRLAATSPISGLTEPLTFASSDGSVAAKLVKGDDSTYEIYLVAEDPTRARGVLTRLMSSSGDLIFEGVSDEFGVLFLPLAAGLDPSAARVELILPHATLVLEPAVWRDRLIATGSAELRSVEGHSLRIEVIERQVRREYRIDFSRLRSERSSCSLRVYATQEGRSTELHVGPEGAALIEEPNAEPTTLRAFVVPP